MISTENESEEPGTNLIDLVVSSDGLTPAEDIPSFILPGDDSIQCKLCFKR